MAGERELEHLERKVKKAEKQLNRARKKVPKRTEYSFQRTFDPETGKAKYVLKAEKKEKAFTVGNPIKRTAFKAASAASGFIHRKVSEVEKENAAVEAAHKTEQKGEQAVRFIMRHRRSKRKRLQRKIARLEQKQQKAVVNYQYQKFLEENPDMQEKSFKKMIQRRIQKQRIKRAYAKANRAGAGAKSAKAAAKASDTLTAVAKKLQEIAAKNASLIVICGAVLLIFLMLTSTLSSGAAMLSSGFSMTMSGSYLSVPAEMDKAETAYTKLEKDLQAKISAIETTYPNYDEYRYNLDAIGHDPFALISYLSTLHSEFTATQVENELKTLFGEMYTLTLHPTTETRTRTVTKTGTRTVTGSDGQPKTETYTYTVQEQYTVTILEVTLKVKSFDELAAAHMNEEQKSLYAFYQESHGMVQQFYTPLKLYWYNYVSSYYGYRTNAATGQEELHRGIDIAVPTGTEVYAAMDGTVTTAAYDSHYGNYVVIEKDGYTTKYAHLRTLRVSAGQTLVHGTPIGTTGSTGSTTGSHLHLECLYNGEYYNPLFYFEVGEGTLYGEAPGAGSGEGNVTPPESYDDATVQKLMDEAKKYLGYPYVWGGSSPSTSFDCSGFVCYVFTASGVHNLPRTTAQGIYNQCTPVSVSDAKAGDIIFFTGTYQSAGAVSHVGIYCGNGVMIHCGDPIKYASINSAYWQSHFYSFGRLN